MIEITDINKWLTPPEGYELDQFDARGAYLWLRYRQKRFITGTLVGHTVIEIYLNDQGREVARLKHFDPVPISTIFPAKPITRQERFKYGMQQIWFGLQEVLICLRGK